MSVTVIVSLKVEDFDKWYAAFSSTSGKREEAGIHAKGHRNIDDPNNAVAIGTAASKEEFLGMFAAPKCRKFRKLLAYLGHLK